MSEDEKTEKKETIPANELGATLRQNGITCSGSTAEEIAEIAKAVNELVDTVGGDPETEIAKIEEVIPLSDDQKDAIRAKFQSDAVGIDGGNKNAYRFIGTSMKSVATALGEMLD